MANVSTFFDLNQAISLSAGHDRMIVFARRSSGELAHIDEVANGKACACVCLACNEALIARQGDVLSHSFAHQSGTECDHALEAMLHGLAVELIKRRQQFVVPALYVKASITTPYGDFTDVRQRPATRVPLDSVELDKRAPWARPCVVTWVKGRELLIHIALHHKADEQERQALARLDQAAVQVDLSHQFPRTLAEFTQILFTADLRKSWLFNHREAAMRAEIQAALGVAADEARRAHESNMKERLERERTERARTHAAVVAARRDFVKLNPVATMRSVTTAQCPPQPPPKPAKPAELSASVEYQSQQGSLWLLHSARPDIYFRMEPGVDHARQVLEQSGATKDGTGVYRISRDGWASAAVRLADFWTIIRSVSGTPEADAMPSNSNDIGQ